MTEIPIACNLTRHGERSRRVHPSPVDAALIAQEEVEGGVRELVDAESICCGFLSFEIARRDGELWLEITGASEARPAIDQFFVAA